MKYFLLVLTWIISQQLLAQDYYVGKGGDTVYCEFKRALPRSIKVKVRDGGTKTFSADEVSAFSKNDIVLKAKKINGLKKNTIIFLPVDKKDQKYLYSDANVVIISGKGVTFYELEEFGGVSDMGRDAMLNFYIENDSLGLTYVPYTQAIGGNTKSADVINALYDYLKSDSVVEKKLNVNESWKTFNYKGIRKLIEEFMGKELVD